MQYRAITFISLIALVLFAGAAQAAKTVTIEGLDSLKFSKENITVAPGEKVTVKLVNKSDLPASAMSHNYVQMKADADLEAFDQAAVKAKDNEHIPKGKSDQVIAHTGLVAGGESESVTFTAPDKTGDYPYICTFPGHFAAGMKGTLTVSK